MLSKGFRNAGPIFLILPFSARLATASRRRMAGAGASCRATLLNNASVWNWVRVEQHLSRIIFYLFSSAPGVHPPMNRSFDACYTPPPDTGPCDHDWQTQHELGLAHPTHVYVCMNTSLFSLVIHVYAVGSLRHPLRATLTHMVHSRSRGLLRA